jgi:hypothetical protein
MNFANVRNNKIIDFNSLYKDNDIERIETTDELYNAWLEDRSKVIYSEGQIILNPDWEHEQEEKEAERIASLNLTKADFWIALLDGGITKAMVKEKIELIPDEMLKAKTLIRLDEADHFWRGDASMDIIGAMFGLTPDDLTYLFENKELPPREEE